MNDTNNSRTAKVALPQDTSNPIMVEVTRDRIFVKTGAEGVFCAALPKYGLDVALKCDDGAVRGSQYMLTAILRRIGAMDDTMAAQLGALINVPNKYCNGARIGMVRPASTLTFNA